MGMEILLCKGGVACDKEGYEYIRIENMNIYRVPQKKCLIAKFDIAHLNNLSIRKKSAFSQASFNVIA